MSSFTKVVWQFEIKQVNWNPIPQQSYQKREISEHRNLKFFINHGRSLSGYFSERTATCILGVRATGLVEIFPISHTCGSLVSRGAGNTSSLWDQPLSDLSGAIFKYNELPPNGRQLIFLIASKWPFSRICINMHILWDQYPVLLCLDWQRLSQKLFFWVKTSSGFWKPWRKLRFLGTTGIVMPAATSWNSETIPPFYWKLWNRLTNIVPILCLILSCNKGLHTSMWFGNGAFRAKFQPPFHLPWRLSGSVSFWCHQ